MIERVTPAVLELLRDGVPRRKAAIITALGDRHPKDEVTRTLMRLAVLSQLVEQAGKYRLAGTEPEAAQAGPSR